MYMYNLLRNEINQDQNVNVEIFSIKCKKISRTANRLRKKKDSTMDFICDLKKT